jgi:hypothetical protein
MNNGSGQGLFGFPRLPSSNSASENLGSSSSAEGHRSFTLYDYLTGNASYNDKDRRIASCTGAESFVSSKLWGSDKVPMKESSLQGLILSDNKVSGKVSCLLTEF